LSISHPENVYMFRSFILCLGLMLSLLTQTICQQTITGTLVHSNTTRNFRLRLPKDFSPAEKLPLVFNFHGFTSNASQQELYSGMNSLADAERFAVCYPNGINAAWNVGWAFGSTADDVGFTEAMIETFVTQYGFDRNRIYACGMSNGGFFSYHLACRLSDKIAAIASITGSMVPGSINNCNPGRTIPVMEIHGTADDVVLYNGSAGISTSVDSVMAFWSNHNDCTGTVIKENLPDINTQDQSTVEKYSYTLCKNDHTVLLYKIIGGGHTWPGAALNIGTTNRDINANVEIWNFFKKYSLPQSSATLQTEENVQVYPNPVYDKLYIHTEFPIQKTEIRAMNGATVAVFTHTQNFDVIDLEFLPPGLYMVQIQSEQKSLTKKLVKL
jgi:polyhydroxybutyrate depolymerase